MWGDETHLKWSNITVKYERVIVMMSVLYQIKGVIDCKYYLEIL